MKNVSVGKPLLGVTVGPLGEVAIQELIAITGPRELFI